MNTKKLLIIGMGPGIAFSVANRFASQGFEIAMMARRTDKLKEFEDFFVASGRNAHSYAADIANEHHFDEQLRTYIAEHGVPDVMLYNASSFNAGTPLTFAYDQLVTDFKVNVAGAMQAAQAMIPAMEKRGYGKCFFTGGGSATNPFMQGFSLSIGKAGMRNLVLMLAEECKKSPVHVATVTIHGMVQRGGKFDPDAIAEKYWELYMQLPNERVTEIDVR
jgi:NADP-dependent 3-hydroxy acid dehydrogenase YdfG